ncbi:MAG: AsmA family protein [Pseudomonadota bacterium]
MKTALKWILGIISIVFIAAIVLIMTLDFDQIRQRIEKLALKDYKTQLKIEKIGLSIWPSLGLSLETISAKNEKGEPLFSTDTASASLSLLPLLKRQVDIENISFEKPELTWIQQGEQSNWSSLIEQLSAKSKTEEDKKTSTDTKPLALELQNFRLVNARVLYQDGPTTYRLDPINLNIDHFKLDGQPFPLKLSILIKEAETQIQAEIKGTLSISPDYQIIRSEMLLKTVYKTPEIPEVNMLTNAKFAMDSAKNVLKFSLADGRVIYRDSASVWTVDPIKLNIDHYKLDQRTFPLTLALTAKQGETRIKSDIKATSSLSADYQMVQSKFDMKTQYKTPGMPDMNVQTQGDIALDLAKSDFKLNIPTLRLNEMLGSLFAQAKLPSGQSKTVPLTLTANVKFDTLDIDAFLPKDNATEVSAPKENISKETDTPLPIDTLKNLKANIDVSVKKIRYQGIESNNVALNAKANNGIIQVTGNTKETFGGGIAFDADLNVNQNPAQLKVNKKINGVQLDNLLARFISKEKSINPDNYWLSGLLGMTAATTAQGNSVNALMKSVKGSADLQIANGVIEGLSMQKSLYESLGKLGPVLTPLINSGTLPMPKIARAETLLKTISAHLAFNAKEISIQKLAADLTDAALKGDIAVSLEKQNYVLSGLMDLRADWVNPKLRGIDWPIRCEGSWTGIPSCSIETKSAKKLIENNLKSALKSKAEERVNVEVEKAQKKVEEKVQNKLEDKLKSKFGDFLKAP